MREIKFRGQVNRNQDFGSYVKWVHEWVAGYYSVQNGFHYIQQEEIQNIKKGVVRIPLIEVDPDTIGQYTGLKDKHGVEIYEGDIVRWDDCSNGRHWRIAIVKINPDIQFDCSLGFSYNGMNNSSKDIFSYGNFIYKDTHNYLEVIGNIHDNPELLTK